jgi:dihydrofolate synthase / folylpolyglutamate synthase
MATPADEVAALAQLTRQLDELIPAFRWSSESNLKLERIDALVAHLGHPERAYPSIHVGGTSGKGTVATFAAAVLAHHGLRTGLHLSPDVQTLTESWQIDGRYARPSELLPVLEAVAAAGEPIAADLPFGAVSIFETEVAMAFEFFARQGVDIAVVEVGVGGALDATNVLRGGIKVLTNVGLDHTKFLGDTVEQIASDKVQIFKPDSVIVSGVEQPSVQQIVRLQAEAVKAPVFLLDTEVQYRRVDADTLRVTLDDVTYQVAIPATWPEFQLRNATLALAACHFALPALDAHAASVALRSVHLPGRRERFVHAGRDVVLDGAHNPDKIRTTVESVRAWYPSRKVVGVVALKEDKDVEASLGELRDLLSGVVFTTFEREQWIPLPPDELAAQFVELGFTGPALAIADYNEAFETAVSLTEPGDVVLIVGSLYLAGNLRSRWVSTADDVMSGRSFDLPT